MNCARVILSGPWFIESTYADLIDSKKTKFYRGGTVTNFIADLTVSFPGLQITFCKNRKIANE